MSTDREKIDAQARIHLSERHAIGPVELEILFKQRDELAALAQAGGSGDGVREAADRMAGAAKRLGMHPGSELMKAVAAYEASPPTAEVRGGWQPIETVKPIVGRWMLVGNDGSCGSTWVTQAYWDGEKWRGETPDDGAPGWCPLHYYQPTHVMPLPAAPSAERTGE